MKERILIKYFDKDAEELKLIGGEKSDWIDLRSAEDVDFMAGEFKPIKLGVAMELPEGYEAHVVPRSSTFKNTGLLMVNSVGIIDNSYNGPDDQWIFPAYATQTVHIEKGQRICQFRIFKKQPEIEFVINDLTHNKNRGGHGSTGTK